MANLPFSLDDKALADIFEGTGVVSTHVVKTKNGRSRGYGFVEFGSSEHQIAALQTKQGFKVVGQNGVERALSISVSSSVVNPEGASNSGTIH